MSAPGIHLEGVSHSFDRGRTHALSDIELSLPAGRRTVLLGESGSGKSTLLRIIAGLTAPTRGVVRLEDRVLSDPAIRIPPEQRGIGMVFQGLELWPHMTVAEHIGFGLPGRPRGRRALASAEVRAHAAEVGLDEALLRRRPDTLSGGERQRVAIARTLAADPAVLLFDEPLSSLDPSRRASLRRLIRKISAAREVTVVYVTHDPDEALEMGEHIVVFEQGRVTDAGTGPALYRTPATLAGARALGPVNVVPVTPTLAGLESPLGLLTPLVPIEPQEGQRLVALLRPDAVRVGTDDATACTRAVVTTCVAAPGGFRFEARVDALDLLGTSPDALDPGAEIQVRVGGPVHVIEVAASDAPEPLAVGGAR